MGGTKRPKLEMSGSVKGFGRVTRTTHHFSCLGVMSAGASTIVIKHLHDTYVYVYEVFRYKHVVLLFAS